MLPFHFPEFTSLNLSLEISYIQVYSDFPNLIQTNGGIVPYIDHDCFLSSRSQFIVGIHLSATVYHIFVIGKWSFNKSLTFFWIPSILSREVKWPELDATHQLPSSA
jgi:hypothetical protein